MSKPELKLFLVHCGFYDALLLDGMYESHVNFMVVATNAEEARAKAKANPDFQNKRMHVDGLQEIEAIDGFRIDLTEDASLEGQSRITTIRHRDLAPKKVEPTSS